MKKVKVGSRVMVKFEDGETEIIEIANCSEANNFFGKVSVDAPLAKAIIGKQEGMVVTYLNDLKGRIGCTILKII